MNYLQSFRKLSLLILVSFLFHQCKMYDNPGNTKELSQNATPPNFEVPDYWELGETDSLSVQDDWYYSFNEPLLNQLIDEALDTTNMAIMFQLAKIDENRARVKLAESGKKVKVGYSGVYSGFSATGNAPDSYDLTVGVPISWEADLWGKIEAGILAADQNVLSSMYSYDYTRQSIAATVSNAYFRIGLLNESLDVAEQFLELNERIVDILRTREEVGIIDMQEVYLTEAQINNVKSIIAQTENEVQRATRELEILIGRYPENKLKIDWVPQQLDSVVSISNPFALINRRPDIKANESAVRAAFYLNEQAELARKPSFVLNGSIGFSTLYDLVFGTGASILGPIFDGGVIQSRIDGATAVQKQVVANYGQSILTAFKEVETSLDSQRIINEQYKYLLDSEAETKKAYDIAVEQYRVGRIDLYYVLQLQSQLLFTELDLLRVDAAKYFERVQLHLALGGNITSK